MIDRDELLSCALLSAREEAFLWELIGDLQAQFPAASPQECEEAARQSAALLLENGWAQLVVTRWSELGSAPGSVISQQQALEVIADPRNWKPPSSNQTACFHLLVTESGCEQPFG